MKKSSMGIMISLTLVAIILLACGGAWAKDTITLKWAHYAAENNPRYKNINFFADRVKELSNGELELKVYPGEQLVKAKEELEAVMRGSVDMVSMNINYIVGKLPLLNIYDGMLFTEPGELTELCYRTKDVLTDIFQKVNSKYLWAAELEKMALISKLKLMKVPKDTTNLKVRAPGNFVGFVKRWGGQGVSIPNPEIYMALQRGVTDAALCGIATVLTQKLWEVSDYLTSMNTGSAILTVMNMKSWNKLSDNHKQILEKVSEEMLPVAKKNAVENHNYMYAEAAKHFRDVYMIEPHSDVESLWLKPLIGYFPGRVIEKYGAEAAKIWARHQEIAKEMASERAKK